MTYSEDAVFELLTHVDLVLVRVWEHNPARPYQYAQFVMTFIQKWWSASGHLIQ